MRIVHLVNREIKNLLEEDINVKTVSHGDIDLVALDKTSSYALSHFKINAVTYGEYAWTVEVQLFCMDVVDISNDKEHDLRNIDFVQNDQLAVMMRLLDVLRRGDQDEIMLTGEPRVEFFEERFNDRVAGVEALFTITVPNDMTICDEEVTYESLGTKYWYGTIANPELEYPTDVGTSDVYSVARINTTVGTDSDVDLWFDSNGEISLNSPVGDGTIGNNINYSTLADYIAFFSATELYISVLRNHYNTTDLTDQLVGDRDIDTFRLWSQSGGFETDPNTGKVAIQCLGLADQILEGIPNPLLEEDQSYSISSIVSNSVDTNVGTFFTTSNTASPDNDRLELRANTQAAGTFWFYFDGTTPSSTLNYDTPFSGGQLQMPIVTWDAGNEIGGFSHGQRQNSIIDISGTLGYENRTFRVGSNRVASTLFNGFLSLLRVHDRDLTDSEALGLYNLDTTIS